MIYLILAYLIICPLSYWIGIDLRIIQEIMFQCASLILITAGLVLKPKQSEFDKFNVPIIALLGWFIALYFLNNFSGIGVLVNTFLGIGVYLTITRHIAKDNFRIISKTLMGIAIFSMVYFGLQCLGYDLRNVSLIDNAGNPLQGIPKCSCFGIEHAFGMYLGMVLPLVLGIGGILSWILLPFFLICMIFAKSSGVMIGSIVSILFFYWFRKRLIFWIMLIPLVSGLLSFLILYDNPMGMQKSRIDMWKKVQQDSWIKPFGSGLDTFRIDERNGARHYFKYPYNNMSLRVVKVDNNWMIEKTVDPNFSKWIEENKDKPKLDFWDNCHNIYTTLFYETGIPGFGIVCFILYSIWLRFWRSKKNVYAIATMSALIGISIFAGTQFPFHIARLGHLIPVIAGLFFVSTGENFGKNIV